MLHDVWFWIAAGEGLLILGVTIFVIWVIKTLPPPAPRMTGWVRGRSKEFDVTAEIGHKTGEVLISFDSQVTGFSVTPANARYMAKIFNGASDCAEGHAQDATATKVEEIRPTAWDRVKG